ncbi:MAG: hypothetical protein A2X66_01345 [Ignavibacteria bacterium GWA2_54_16]|nr:MAG: hypothetical protein A2X66_01345 [Ignavibacteria bacterium GWA2_54_16]
MKISTMRLIDRFVGMPLCWIAGIFRRFPESQSPSIRSVLVIKFFGLGSVLLTSPALQALKHKFPDSKVIFLSFSRNKEILEEIPFIEERWIIDSDSMTSFVKSFLIVLRRLLFRRIDVVVDFEFFSKFSTLVGALARPRMQIGFALPTRWRRWNLSHSVVLAGDRHVTESFLAMLAPLGLKERALSLPRISSSRTADGTLELPVQVRLWRADVICINPNAGETSLDRRWEASRYRDVLEILLEDYRDVLFCLIGSAHERGYVQHILEQVRIGNERVVNLAGRTSIQGLIELFCRSRMLITNDSGPMHLAAAAGLPTVALFGPESPTFYGPLGNQSINLYVKLGCSPCLNLYDAKTFRCPIDAKCMKDIPVDWVVKATAMLMESVKVPVLVESTSV